MMKKYYVEIFVLGLIAFTISMAMFRPTVDRNMKLIRALYQQAGYKGY